MQQPHNVSFQATVSKNLKTTIYSSYVWHICDPETSQGKKSWYDFVDPKQGFTLSCSLKDLA